jgi:hypothetical protein
MVPIVDPVDDKVERLREGIKSLIAKPIKWEINGVVEDFVYAPNLATLLEGK